ncbi:MAG: AMIN domain-containing protein [Nostocales cyanobacterium]|nr:MAG: AMIN domain-containing protein [Nostocales cyanobacterium]TAF13925.1 MAG: AMIN domain-containing protein [Nostocales cyanobacterium]
MKLPKLLFLLLLTGANTSLIHGTVKAEIKDISVRENVNLVTQNIAQNQQLEATEINQVTGVTIKEVDSKIELILETANPEKLQVVNRSQGNDFIAEIPNTQIKLSTGERFEQQQPIQGVSEVTITNKDEKTIVITVKGETELPTVNLFEGTGNLIFEVQPKVTGNKPENKPEISPERLPETNNQIQSNQPIELVVTANRTAQNIQRVPRSITVIKREDIEKQTKLSNNLIEILGKTVPGLAAPTQSSSSFGQGLRGRNTLVLIDGIPQSTSRNAFRDLQTIDPSAIERIEVVRGPSAIYGDGATGGVINIITKQATENKITTTAELGLNTSLGNLESDGFGGDVAFGISGKQDNFDFIANIAYRRIGNSYDADGDLIPSNPNGQGGLTDSNSLNIFGKFGVNLDSNQRLQLSFNRFDEEQDTDVTNDPIVNTLPGRQKARALKGLSLDELPGNTNTQVNLQYNHDDAFLNSKIQAQVYYRDYLTRFFPFDGRAFASLGNEIFQSQVESEKFGGRLQIETPIAKDNQAKLLWGIDYFHEDTVQPVITFDPVAFNNSGGLAFRRNGQRVWTPPIQTSSVGLFAQLNWEVTDKLAFNGGLRYENASLNVDNFSTLANPNVVIQGGNLDFNATLFNAGLAYAINDNASVFANFSQGFSLADVGLVLRNAAPGFSVESLSPEPQRVNNYEIGFRGQWDKVSGSISAFYNESDLGTTFTAPGTVLRAPERIYGLEAAVDFKPSSTLNFGSTFTLMVGEIDIANNGDYSALDGFRIPPIKVTAYVENQTTPSWNNRLQALFSGSRNVFENSTVFGRQEVESYFVLDYISSIKLGSGSLQIGIENLLDSQYFPVVSQLQSSDSSYAAGRGRTLSFKYLLKW